MNLMRVIFLCWAAMRSWCSWKAPENGRQGVRMRRKCTLRGPGIAHGQKLLSWVPGLSIIESSCSVSTHFLLSVFFHLSISLSLSPSSLLPLPLSPSLSLNYKSWHWKPVWRKGNEQNNSERVISEKRWKWNYNLGKEITTLQPLKGTCIPGRLGERAVYYSTNHCVEEEQDKIKKRKANLKRQWDLFHPIEVCWWIYVLENLFGFWEGTPTWRCT